LIAFASSPVAGAYPYGLAGPTLASTASPFAGCAIGSAGPSSVNSSNTEPEPFVAVDPTNTARVIGVHQQDRWNDGGARGLVADASSDGGLSWPTHSYAAFSACSGGNPDYERASDPWVTFDTAGNAYQISLSISADLATSAVLVSRSTDHGVTWGPPATLTRDDDPLHFNDKESITGDPTRPGYVYAVWDRTTFPSDRRNPRSFLGSHAYRGQPMFARTTDGGATWSAPRALTNANIFTIGNQLAVLPDGTLIDVFADFRGAGNQPSANDFFEAVTISKDAGLTWSRPIKVANIDPIPLVDPDTGAPVRADDYLPDIAVDPRSGALYVVWSDAGLGDGTYLDVVISESTDGGRTWSPPAIADGAPPGVDAFNGTVAVTGDGTVAVLSYDFRNNDAAPGLPTDVWLSHSHDGGGTWNEQHLAGSFDMERAPDAGGYFLGDYQGLAAAGNDLIALFTTTIGDRANTHSVHASAP
jgi:Neuraminidase (sialidase)